MNPVMSFMLLATIGLAAGLTAGFFGVGGGIIIIPALVYLLGFSQTVATGTSLAILLPPVGLAAVITYYRYGNVDLRAAIVIAIFLFFGAWISSIFANRMNPQYLKLAFGVFVTIMGLYIVATSVAKLPG